MAYQAGDRVALVHTSDPYTLLTPGTAGTVTGYDERLGQLDMAWDDGSSLSMLLRDGDQVRLLAPRGRRTRDGRLSPRQQARPPAIPAVRGNHVPAAPAARRSPPERPPPAGRGRPLPTSRSSPSTPATAPNRSRPGSSTAR